MAEIDWKREFDGLGSSAVRAAVNSGRWEAAKRSAAREWLERSDAMAWQSTRRGDDGPTVTTFDVLRRYKWVYVAAGGAFGLLAVAQIVGKIF